MTPGRPQRPEDDPAWAQYPQTILEFYADADDDGPALRVDLRRPVPAEARERLAALGLDGPFAVVTAAAPGGDAQHDAFDRARQAELDESARLHASVTRRVDGVSPDGGHRERSIALAVPKGEAVALGRRWQQSAVFWWDGRDFWLLGALVAAAPVRLPPA